MELMQASVVYQSSNQHITNKNDSDGSKKASDDDEDSKDPLVMTNKNSIRIQK
jgi:hypothetical protein